MKDEASSRDSDSGDSDSGDSDSDGRRAVKPEPVVKSEKGKGKARDTLDEDQDE